MGPDLNKTLAFTSCAVFPCALQAAKRYASLKDVRQTSKTYMDRPHRVGRYSMCAKLRMMTACLDATQNELGTVCAADASDIATMPMTTAPTAAEAVSSSISKKNTRTPIGAHCFHSFLQPARMESFFIAETLKYLLLLQAFLALYQHGDAHIVLMPIPNTI